MIYIRGTIMEKGVGGSWLQIQSKREGLGASFVGRATVMYTQMTAVYCIRKVRRKEVDGWLIASPFFKPPRRGHACIPPFFVRRASE